MNPTIRSAVDWMRRRAENIVAGLLGIMFVAFIVQIVFRYFFNFPIGWTSELSVIAWLYMTLLGSAFWLKESDEIRFDLISGTLGPRGTARGRPRRRGRGGRPVRHGAAGHDQVRRLHEGREHVVPQDPPRHPVFGLRRLRGGRDRPLSLGDREPRFAARRRKRSTSPRRAPDYEPDQPVLPGAHRHRRAEPDRAAGRLLDDRRVDPLPVPRGPRHGDRGRAAAERHDGEASCCSPSRCSSSPPNS